MPIEKEFKNINETLNLSPGENKVQFFQLKKLFLTHRSNSRQKLSFDHGNFTTFFTFLPFALAFSQFLTQHLSSHKTESFFQKNLPIFTSFQPKLNFETFEYIVKSNKNVLLTNFENTFLFGQPNFLAKIKKPALVDTKKFTGLSCDFYLISSGKFLSKLSSVEQLVRNLDELPSYIKGLNNVYTVHEPLTLFSQKNNSSMPEISGKPNYEFLEKTQNILQAKSQRNQISLSINGLKLPIGENKLRLVKDFETKAQKSSPSPSQVNFSQNEFYKNRLDFYNNLAQLNTELQNFFIEKLSSPVSVQTRENELTNLKIFLKTNSYGEDIVLSDKIFQKFETKQISGDLEGFRLMSGYKYPDMTSSDVFWFSLFNKNQTRSGIKPVYNVSSAFSPLVSKKGFKLETVNLPLARQSYNFSIKNLPRVLIETKNLLLRSLDQNKLVYNEPSLVVDYQKGLDWETHGEENLRSWFHSYLSPLNPLVQRQENFFGNYYSPEFLGDEKNADLVQKENDFTTKSFLRLKFSKKDSAWVISHDSIQSLFVPFHSSLHIPSELNNKKTWTLKEKGNIKGIHLNFSKNEELNKVESFLPLVQLNPPSFRSSPGSSEILQLSPYSSIFDFSFKGNPDYTFCTDCLNEKSFITKHASGRYKKMSSLFSKTSTSTSIFVDNWEPLTSSSWLVISQLSFAVFIFQVLKSLADNYGRELLGYLLDLVAALGILDDALKQQIETLMGHRNKGFRVVLESQKTFTDIVGIDKLLPEIYEVIWFLRNSARDFALSKTLPRGILLTGPPGTGKTLLVQALAGEAQVPVIVLSGSSLIEPGESGADKLQLVFQEARQLAPCIVFIDEIDTLSAKRTGVTQNPMGLDEVLESLSSVENSGLSFANSARTSALDFTQSSVSQHSRLLEHNSDSEKQAEQTIQPQSHQQQLILLTQLLIELDGIQGRDGVVVIGATNRPDVLDPALLRPGRFDKILQVGLPAQQKRIEILQFYGQGLGYQQEIPWNYLGERTAGFSAADLATLMNESTIKAILNQGAHTIETIEHGIDRLTTSESEKYTVLKTQPISTNNEKLRTLSIASKMSILRLAYYQAGKIVLSHVLETHPKSIFASLWPRRPTIRSIQITANLQNSVFEFLRLREVTDRLVGCYAGKAAEFLFLEKFSEKGPSQISTLGLEDLMFAQKLVYCIVDNWGFSKKNQIQKTITLRPNINLREFRETPEKLDFYSQFVETIEIPPMAKALEIETSSLQSTKDQENGCGNTNTQMYYSIPWWQKEISDELEFVEKNFANGSRLYLPNSDRNERNPEWVPPDEFYHSSSGLKNVKIAFANLLRVKRKKQRDYRKQIQSATSDSQKENNYKKTSFPWNEVQKLTRDYPAHSLVLQSFNKALIILDQNRELLDRLVVELLYQEVLRQPEVENLLKEFEIKKISTVCLKNEIFENEQQSSLNQVSQEKEIKILESAWGPQSRKPLPRWIDFAKLRSETT